MIGRVEGVEADADAKGAGEVSTIPTAAAVISAIEDALQPFGVRIAQMNAIS